MKIRKLLPCIGISLSLCACSTSAPISTSLGKASEDILSEQTEKEEPHAPAMSETPDLESETPAPKEEEPSQDETQDTRKITGYEDWKSSEALDALIRALTLEETITEGSIEGNSYYDGLKTGNTYYLDEVMDILGYQFEKPLQIVRYAFADMDNDGQPEALVEMANGGDGWYKVLHYDNGKVFSFSFVYRGFEDPNADGIYIGSNGAADNYYLHLSFDEEKAKEIVAAYSQSNSSGEEFVIHYYIGDKEVPEEDFIKYSDEQENKDGIIWHDYITEK